MKLIILKDYKYGNEIKLLCQSLSKNNNITTNTNTNQETVCLLNTNNQRLRLYNNNDVSFQKEHETKTNKKGRGTAFFIILNDNNLYSIKSCTEEFNGLPIYIGFNEIGNFITYQDDCNIQLNHNLNTNNHIDNNDNDKISKLFTINTIESYDKIDKSNIILLKKDNNTNNRRSLSYWELQRFIMEGYLHVPNIIDINIINNCLRFLNYHLGIPGSVTPGGAQNGLGKLSGSISNSKEVRDLLYESLYIIEDIIGENNCDIDNPSAQIAFRFPEYNNKDNSKEMDNTQWHTDDLRKGKSHGFSILLGICLNDINDDFSGNLLVWPGSHYLIHQSQIGSNGDIDKDRLKSLKTKQQIYLNEDYDSTDNILTSNDTIDNNNNNNNNNNNSNSNSNNSNNSNNNNDNNGNIVYHNNEPLDLPNLGNPYQVKCKAGDIVLLNPDLAHAGGPNYSHEIRKMIYFRLRIKTTINNDWDEIVKQHQRNLFSDFKNIKFQKILKSLSSFNIMTGPEYS